MKLTEENKKHIDGLSYRELLAHWRTAPAGDKWFQDETGVYWGKRMSKLKAEDPGAAVQASKDIGWDKPPLRR